MEGMNKVRSTRGGRVGVDGGGGRRYKGGVSYKKDYFQKIEK